MVETLRLEGWGGQNCDVEIVKRDKRYQGCDLVFARFESQARYGWPSLELSEVHDLLKRMETMAE